MQEPCVLRRCPRIESRVSQTDQPCREPSRKSKSIDSLWLARHAGNEKTRPACQTSFRACPRCPRRSCRHRSKAGPEPSSPCHGQRCICLEAYLSSALFCPRDQPPPSLSSANRRGCFGPERPLSGRPLRRPESLSETFS